MSLRVWLPLNGTLENKGLDDLTVTKIGTLNYSDSGKIGKSIIFSNDCANYLYLPGFKLQVFSWCCWFKCLGEGSSSSQMVISEGRDYSTTGAYGTNIRITKAGTGLWCTAHKVTSSTFPIELNKWYHFVMIADGSYMKYYLNGELKQTQAYSADSDYSDSNDVFVLGKMAYGYTSSTVYFPFNGQLNDVRIYDHALSLKEIKEISKGLILHYPLDNNGFGNENLLTGSQNFSGSWVNGNYWTTSQEQYQNFTVKEKSTVWGGLIQNIPCKTGDIFTISFYGKVTLGGKICSIHRSSLGNVTTGLTILKGNFSSGTDWVLATEDGTQWKRYWATVRIDSSDITYLQWRIENSIADQTLYLCGMKIEKGSNATPWSPNPSDLLCSRMELENNLVYDCSGYENHGEIYCNGSRPNLLYLTGMEDRSSFLFNYSATNVYPFVGYNGSSSLHTFTISDSGGYEDTILLNSTSNLGIAFMRFANDIELDSNSYYTLSCEAKCTNASKQLCIGLSYYNIYNSPTWRGGSNPQTFNVANTWKTFSLTFKPDADTKVICYCFTVVGNSGGTDTYTIRHCKLEKGSSATAWIPNEKDSIYSSLVTPITYAIDTPKYNYCTYISDGLSNYITTPQLNLPGDQITINFWFKSNNTNPPGSYHIPFASNPAGGEYEISIPTNGNIRGGLYVNNTRYVDNGTSTKLLDNNWHMCTMTYDGSTIKRYVDTISEKSTSVSGSLKTTESFIIGHYGNSNTYGCKETYISDLRIYTTALSQQDILQLYKVRALADKNQNFYSTAKFNEQGYSNEIEYLYDLSPNGSYSGTYSQQADGIHLNGYYWLKHDFIPISSTNKTYKYDITYSVSAGNQFYIGWERYDANKTGRSNNATVYVVSIKPSTDQNYVKVTGTVDLSTDGVNPCAFIRLRVLNYWTGSTENTQAKATIHSLSLKEFSTSDNFIPVKIYRTGMTQTTQLIQKNNINKIYVNRSQQINAQSFIED